MRRIVSMSMRSWRSPPCSARAAAAATRACRRPTSSSRPTPSARPATTKIDGDRPSTLSAEPDARRGQVDVRRQASIPVFRDEVDDLRALKPPKADRDDGQEDARRPRPTGVDQADDRRSRRRRPLKRSREARPAGRAEDGVQREAKAYGLTACGSDAASSAAATGHVGKIERVTLRARDGPASC